MCLCPFQLVLQIEYICSNHSKVEDCCQCFVSFLSTNAGLYFENKGAVFLLSIIAVVDSKTVIQTLVLTIGQDFSIAPLQIAAYSCTQTVVALVCVCSLWNEW